MAHFDSVCLGVSLGIAAGCMRWPLDALDARRTASAGAVGARRVAGAGGQALRFLRRVNAIPAPLKRSHPGRRKRRRKCDNCGQLDLAL